MKLIKGFFDTIRYVIVGILVTIDEDKRSDLDGYWERRKRRSQRRKRGTWWSGGTGG